MAEHGTSGERRERRERVTMQLGAAVYAALGVIVGEYLGASDEESEAAPALMTGTERVWERASDTEENGSFDPERFAALQRPTQRNGAEEHVPEPAIHDEARGMTEKETGEAGRRRTFRSRAGRAEGAAAETAGAAADGAPEQSGGDVPFAFGETETTRETELSARGVSAQIERDARRYDGNFYLY